MTENILTKFVLSKGSSILFNEEINKGIRKGLEKDLGHIVSKDEKVIVNMLFTTFMILAEERTKKGCQDANQEWFNKRANYIVSLIKNYLGVIDEQFIKEVQAN